MSLFQNIDYFQEQITLKASIHWTMEKATVVKLSSMLVLRIKIFIIKNAEYRIPETHTGERQCLSLLGFSHL